MATVVSIVYSPPAVNPRPEDHYARVPVQGVTLVAGKGIAGDRKAAGGKRQLNLMASATQQQLRGEGFHSEPGQLGEQIVIDGLDIDNLPPGRRLRLGAEAVVEVGEPRTGCDRFERIQGKFKGLVRGRLGVMARVVRGGAVSVGDDARMEE